MTSRLLEAFQSFLKRTENKEQRKGKNHTWDKHIFLGWANQFSSGNGQGEVNRKSNSFTYTAWKVSKDGALSGTYYPVVRVNTGK